MAINVNIVIPWGFFLLVAGTASILYRLAKLAISVESQEHARCLKSGWNQCCLEYGHQGDCLVFADSR